MKKTILLVLSWLFCVIAFGQSVTVSLPTITAIPQQVVYIPVKLTGAGSSGIPISSANIQITYDTAVLKYDTLVNFYSGTPVNQWFYSGHDGLVSANWLEPNLLTLAIPDNTTLYEIKFTYKGGNSPLIFIVNEFTDAAYNLIPTTVVNGAVNAVTHQVTFQVDMSNETVSSDGVHLAGSFNGWSYTQTPMTLTSSNIYAATLTLNENEVHQYRFVNGNTAAGLENVPAGCGVMGGNGYNRQITVPTHDTAYTSVCFSGCSHCPANVSVTFKVDMQHVTVSPNGVHVAGNFNSWNYGQALMSFVGGTIYQYSVILVEGTYIEYRFANGNTAQDAETIPAVCSPNGNRFMTVPGYDTVMTSFCYDSCLACGTAAHFSHVTFQVDMRTKSISPGGVHIAGTFQGWDPAATPMINMGDSIYSYTDSLMTNTSVLFKYVNGDDSTGFEIVPFACSSNGEREILVPFNDTVLRLVCFGECDTCVISGLSEQKPDGLLLEQNHPNPFFGITNIGYRLDQEGFLQLKVYNSTGLLVRVLYDGNCQAGSYTVPFPTQGLPSGIYYYQVNFTGGNRTYVLNKKMILL
jgi:hypothetical protein